VDVKTIRKAHRRRQGEGQNERGMMDSGVECYPVGGPEAEGSALLSDLDVIAQRAHYRGQQQGRSDMRERLYRQFEAERAVLQQQHVSDGVTVGLNVAIEGLSAVLSEISALADEKQLTKAALLSRAVGAVAELEGQAVELRATVARGEVDFS
jgi:hypothetical protein